PTETTSPIITGTSSVLVPVVLYELIVVVLPFLVLATFTNLTPDGAIDVTVVTILTAPGLMHDARKRLPPCPDRTETLGDVIVLALPAVGFSSADCAILGAPAAPSVIATTLSRNAYPNSE